MIETREMLAPLGSACRSGIKRSGMIGVTIHETANTNAEAGALMHAKYLQGAGQYNSTSWHYAVDDKLVTRSIPENEVAWHAGDGHQGNGNNKTIAVEICVNSGSNYEIAFYNAAELAAGILARYKFDDAEEALFVHKDWSGKNCPAIMLRRNRWPEFNKLVQKIMNEKYPGINDKQTPDFVVYQRISGHMTAAEAISGMNPVSLVQPGSYYVFREVAEAVNVTKVSGVPGSWINCRKNALAKLEEIKVGDLVRLQGRVYRDSYGAGESKAHYDLKGKITKVANLNRSCPFHFEKLGWAEPDSIDEIV